MSKPLHRKRLNRVVGRQGLVLLAQARSAWPRIEDPEDSEGLHDFRVALRRLRSWLKAYRGYPGVAIPKTQRRRLRDLARATNEARDGEVMLAWLEAERPSLGNAERGAVDWWSERLRARVEADYAEARCVLEAGFPGLDRELGETLAALAKKGGGPRFGEATARELAALRETLTAEIAAIDSPESQEALHRPRITGKRIRYLLKPWKWEAPIFDEAEKAMKAFQDAFGVLHDDLVREPALTAAAAAHAEEEAREKLVLAAEGEEARAAAPRHLRGFMGLARAHRERRLAHYDRVLEVARSAGPGDQGGPLTLADWLEAALAAMRVD
ncbi:CHAD domain-containing protein [Halomonas sp. SL1]|uniref:CHAD domain-containing protein n=1 Tax=Halomonas sp. SL1 TaxID=2137478 RepID=UPI000D162C90|nr:CHAD domain-containing protein [Halomonas sp. SL1]RAH37503.1 CHAD domain-containing protein [Halomonas sp. SL1]